MVKPLLIEVAIRINGKPARNFGVVYYKLRRKPETNEYLLIVPRSEAEMKQVNKLAAERIGKKIESSSSFATTSRGQLVVALDHKYVLSNVTLIDVQSIESWARAAERPEQPFGSRVTIHAESITDLEKKGQRTLMAPHLTHKK